MRHASVLPPVEVGEVEPVVASERPMHAVMHAAASAYAAFAPVHTAMSAAQKSAHDPFAADTALQDSPLPEFLRGAVEKACAAIFKAAQEEPRLQGMGTTTISVLFHGGHAFLAHVGDSRAYLVRDGRIVGRGHTQPPGEAHAEVMALRDAGDLARGTEVFVTLEPCSHTGMTGPCAQALAAMRAAVQLRTEAANSSTSAFGEVSKRPAGGRCCGSTVPCRATTAACSRPRLNKPTTRGSTPA